MTSFQTEGIILRRTNYGEADRILNVLSPDHGKLSLIAKGVRKPSSKLAGSIELLSTIKFSVNQGRVEVGLITSARIIEFYGDIITEYERMQVAYELLKLINRVTEGVAEPEFYELLRDGLGYLNQLTINHQLSELWFRLRLLTLLGRGLNLVRDVSDAALIANQQYSFDFNESAFRPEPSARFTTEHLKLLRLATLQTPDKLMWIGGIERATSNCLWLVRALEG